MEDHSGGIFGLKLRAVCITSVHTPSPRIQSYNRLYQQKRLGNVILLCVQEAGKAGFAEYLVSAIGDFQFIAIMNNLEMHTTLFQSLFTFLNFSLEHIIYSGHFGWTTLRHVLAFWNSQLPYRHVRSICCTLELPRELYKNSNAQVILWANQKRISGDGSLGTTAGGIPEQNIEGASVADSPAVQDHLWQDHHMSEKYISSLSNKPTIWSSSYIHSTYILTNKEGSLSSKLDYYTEKEKRVFSQQRYTIVIISPYPGEQICSFRILVN